MPRKCVESIWERQIEFLECFLPVSLEALSSLLMARNLLKIKRFKAIILHVWYGFGTWFLILMEEYWL